MTTARISSAGFARSSASEDAPTEVANSTPSCSFSGTVFSARPRVGLVKNAPLCPIALCTSCRVSGEAMSALTDSDPADSPLMVTLPGSPPNAATLRVTHWSAAT